MSRPLIVYSIAAVLVLTSAYLARGLFQSADQSEVSGREQQLQPPAAPRKGQGSMAAPRESKSIFKSIWDDDRLREEGRRGMYNRPIAEQLKIEGELNRVLDLYEANEFSELEKSLIELINEAPDVAEYRAMLGDHYHRFNQYPKAEEQIEAMLELDPTNPVALARLAEIKTIVGKRDDAEDLIDSLLEQYPASVDGIMGRITLYEMAGENDLAERFLEDHRRRYADDPGVQTVYALQRAERGNLDEGERLLRNITKDQPGFFPAVSGLAQLNMARGRHEQAAEHSLNAWRNADNTSDRRLAAELHTAALLAQGGAESTERAIEFLELQLQQDPENLTAQAMKFQLIHSLKQN